MTTTDPRARLDEIKARANDCRSYNFGMRNADRLAHEDAPNMAAALTAVLDLHRPVDIEPSETICHGCSTLRGSGENARYFPFEDYPCPTVTRVTDALGGDRG